MNTSNDVDGVLTIRVVDSCNDRDVRIAADYSYRLDKDHYDKYADTDFEREFYDPATIEDHISACREMADKLGTLFIICLGDNDIGYLMMSYGFGGSEARISRLFLDEKYRGMGYGVGIVEIAKYVAIHGMEYDTIALSVDSRNLDAIKLYERQGFKLVDDSDSMRLVYKVKL